MTRDDVWEALRLSLLEVFPEYTERPIRAEESLRDLGANSVDRAEILMLAMARLKLKVPMIEFAQAKNMSELADTIYHWMQKAS